MTQGALWEAVGRTLFDVGKPAVLVDAAFRCLSVNASFESVLGSAPGSLWDAVPEASRAGFEAAAASRQRATLTFNWREERPVTADVWPLESGLLIVLHPTTSAHPDVLTYEVKEGSGGDLVVHVLTRDGLQRVLGEDDGPCWKQLGRTSECPSCPVRELGSEDRATVVTSAEHGAFAATISVAQRNGPTVTVSTFPVESTTWSELVKVRVGHLASECRLSARERQLLELLLLGRSHTEIATVLNITARTAKFHQQNLLRKLGADSRQDLFRLVM